MMKQKKSREHKSKPEDIGSLLKKMLGTRKWQSRIEQHAVFTFWDDAVGTDISARAQPSYISGGVLWLQVTDSVWMQQLHLQKILLLDIINAKLGSSMITDIRFHLNTTLPEKKGAKTDRRISRPVHKEKMEEFKKTLVGIKDEDIKASLLSLWIKSQTSIDT